MEQDKSRPLTNNDVSTRKKLGDVLYVIFISSLVIYVAVSQKDQVLLIISAFSIFPLLILLFDFNYDLVARMRLAYLQSRHRRVWRRVLIRRTDGSGGPYRTTSSIPLSDLVRWRIEHTPDHSEGIRSLASLEERIASLEASLQASATVSPSVHRS